MAQSSALAKVEKWATDNRKSAQIILDNPEKYPGLMMVWAQIYLKKGLTALALKRGAR
jgi:hypothetical protein